MNRTARICIALLCGIALIWLAQGASALIAATSAFRAMFHWLQSNGWPMWVASPLLLSFLPVAIVSLLVGLLVFQLPERRPILFVSVATPFVLYSLWYGISLLLAAGNSLLVSALDPMPWVSIGVVLLGLSMAHLVHSKR